MLDLVDFFFLLDLSFHKPLGKYKWQKESIYLNVVRPLLLLSPSAQKNHSIPVPALTCSILYTDIFWMPEKARHALSSQGRVVGAA